MSHRLRIMRLWNSDTRWAEAIGGVSMFSWGALNLLSSHAIPDHTFGSTLHWLTRQQLEWLFFVIGFAQILCVLYTPSKWRGIVSLPACFLNLNIVLGVLYSGLFPYGSVAFFAGTAGMNAISVWKNPIGGHQ